MLDDEAAADFAQFEAKKNAPPPPDKSFKEKLGIEDKPKFKRGNKKGEVVVEAPKEVDKCLVSGAGHCRQTQRLQHQTKPHHHLSPKTPPPPPFTNPITHLSAGVVQIQAGVQGPPDGVGTASGA